MQLGVLRLPMVRMENHDGGVPAQVATGTFRNFWLPRLLSSHPATLRYLIFWRDILGWLPWSPSELRPSAVLPLSC